MTVKNYDEIEDGLEKSFLSNQKKVTDLNNASIIKAMFESFATEEEKKYLETKVSFEKNLERVPMSLFGFSNKEGTYSNGFVTFKRSEPKDYVTAIPKNTKVSAGKLVFLTTQQAIIGRGDLTSAEVPITSEKVGIEYNVEPETIKDIDSVLSSDIVEVINNSKTDGGSDKESDAELFVRFKTWLNGIQGTSKLGLKGAVMNIAGVHSVNPIENFDSESLGIDKIYNVVVYAEDGSGRLNENLKRQIEDKIEGDGSYSNPGLRAPGINVLVKEPRIIEVNLKIFAQTYRVDQSVAEFEIENAVKAYINSLGIGESVYLSSLVALLLKLNYVKDAVIKQSNDETTNIIINENEIARFKSAEIDARPL